MTFGAEFELDFGSKVVNDEIFDVVPKERTRYDKNRRSNEFYSDEKLAARFLSFWLRGFFTIFSCTL